MPLQASRTIGTGDGWQRTDSGILLPDWADLPDTTSTAAVELPQPQPIGIDLFAGAGGFSCGFKQAGWHVIAANEWDVDAAHTYLANLGVPAHPDRVLHPRRPGPLGAPPPTPRALPRPARPAARSSPAPAGSRPSPASSRARCSSSATSARSPASGSSTELGLDGDDIGCVFGGPPCQGFSRAGRRQADDPRNELVFEFMRIVCEIHPRSFCMENVPGMLDMVTRDGVPVIDALALMAQEGGMGTFDAIRRSLAETAGAGAALRTMTAGSTRRQPQPGVSANGHIDLEDDQLQLFAGS